MKNSKKKFLSILFSICYSLGCFSLADCHAADEVKNTTIYEKTIKKEKSGKHSSKREKSYESKIYDVYDGRGLTEAVRNAGINDEICLQNDIRLLTSLTINHSLILNLNGHTLTVGDNDKAICVGKKFFVRKDKEEIWHEGYYKTVMDSSYKCGKNGKNTYKYKNVWIPGHSECVYTDVYGYDESVDITFKNGNIVRLSGRNGIDGVEDSDSEYNGYDGETPGVAVAIVSGVLRLESVTIKGGDGGNGGNGGYQSLWHIPFGGGAAGNGGNGGNGGNPIYIEQGHATCSLDSRSLLVKGKPGEGGKAGKPNPNYWIYSGSKGKNGKNGE